MRSMTVNKMASGIIATMILTGASAYAASSDTVLVDANNRSRHWTTLCTNAVPLRWNWNANATHATLEIVGMNNTFTTNFETAVSGCAWQAFGTASPTAEDVYDLTLNFKDGGGNTVESLTSRLAVVAGAFGNAAIDPVADSPTWSKVKHNVVIPYDASWSVTATNAAAATLVIDKVGGSSQTNALGDVAGYTGWEIRNGWGYGTFDLSLTFTGMANEWTAKLERTPDGTAVSLR